jgi:hypothetical protein
MGREKWTRAQRKRFQSEHPDMGLPEIRSIFLSDKMKRKRKDQARRVAERLLRNRKR